MKSMNIVELYTSDGPVHVDVVQLAGRRTLLTAYNANGDRLKDVASTEEIREAYAYGVHRDNLYATQELADEATARIFREIYGTRETAASAC